MADRGALIEAHRKLTQVLANADIPPHSPYPLAPVDVCVDLNPELSHTYPQTSTGARG